MKILPAAFPSAQRIALIGIINNKQVVPIQPKKRFNFARLLSEFLVLCMIIQSNQFRFRSMPLNFTLILSFFSPQYFSQKRAPVNRAGAVLLNHFPVEFRSVAFVAVESV